MRCLITILTRKPHGPAPLAARYAGIIREEFGNFGLLADLSHIPMIHETIEESILPVKDISSTPYGNTVIKARTVRPMVTTIQGSVPGQ